MKKDIYNFTMSCTLKTEYKEEDTLQIFYTYLRQNLMHSQLILNIKKINYHTLIRNSVNDLINETKGIADCAIIDSNSIALYLNNKEVLIARF